jgi:2-C-methyl-D-erythritol 4-phosphate cytidylyltransferase/2-C-methyl-D-erythritol 2,4-cyclodiphosphate synthase
MTIAAIIVAAGKGERAGTSLPKQFVTIGGKALLAHAVTALARHPRIERTVVVVAEGQTELAAQALGDIQVDAIVIGGAERQQSAAAGLAAIGDARIVLIHDAARPFLPSSVIDRLIAALDTADGAIPGLSVVDTLAKAAEELGDVVDRNGLIRVQTPQAFRTDAIRDAHNRWTGTAATDDAQMARAAGYKIAVVEGHAMLDKITQPADFAEAERKWTQRLISRTGLGYDVHRLSEGEDLWLCGVKIDHEKGLAGHSDADVALHALTDALLGALGDGDIGAHFPPSDPQWRGAASHRFVEHAATLIRQAGGVIDHVDVTIICEAPKIGPHRDAMRMAIAGMLAVPIKKVSVKATTTERLGFTGRGEGIAAQAAATIRLPEEE